MEFIGSKSLSMRVCVHFGVKNGYSSLEAEIDGINGPL